MAVLTRTQRRIARAFDDGAHLQLCQGNDLDEDPNARFVLVHTCSPDVDPDGFRYTETVQCRTLFALHMAGKLPPHAEAALGFGDVS